MRTLLGAGAVLLALSAGCAGANTANDMSTPRSSTPAASTEAPSTEAPSTAPEPRTTVTRTETATANPPGTPAPSPPPPPADPVSPCTYTGSTPSIEQGASGAAVQQAQCYLNLALSGEPIPEDGDFGPVTDTATRRFQSCAGITTDGLIGPETWSYLIAWSAAPGYVC